MSLEDDVKTINEYMQWKAVRQDMSPEAFVRDRARQTAYERLSAGIEFVENIVWVEANDSDWADLLAVLNGTA